MTHPYACTYASAAPHQTCPKSQACSENPSASAANTRENCCTHCTAQLPVPMCSRQWAVQGQQGLLMTLLQEQEQAEGQ
jgi:hypothetical protein